MGSLPKSFITDEQGAIIAGFRQYNRRSNANFVHLLDQFHIIKSFSRNMKNYKGYKDWVELVKQIIYTRDR